MDQEGWSKKEKEMSRQFRWKVQNAKKDKIMGRNKGGMITGTRKGINVIEERIDIEGIMESKFKVNGEIWKMISVYNRGGDKDKLKEIKERVEEEMEGNILMMGDFNARTGNKGSIAWNGEEEERKSKDRKINIQGEELLTMVEEKGMGIMNGNKEGDEEGEWTFIGKMGSSVVDYAITSAETWQKIESFKIGERTESDHQPMEIVIQGKMQREEEEEDTEREIEDWSEEGVKKYKEKLENIEFCKEEVQESMKELIEKVKEAISKKKITVKKWRAGRKRWWNRECRLSKIEVNKKLRKYKEGKVKRVEYIEEKRKHKEVCKENEEKYRREEITKIMNLKDENEIWKYIQKERGKRSNMDEGIAKEEWKQHFMNLLEGKDNKEREEPEEKGKAKIEEIREEEVEEAIKKLKKKKSAGIDGIRNEAWKYASDKVKERLREILNKIWRGEGWPEEWKEGIICPIFKKGDKTKAGNYRGVTLMCTSYKIYAMIVEKRLREEVERIEILPETQAGFRKGRSGIDNIYILKTAIEKAINKKEGKLFVFFMDLKAAFDKVKREKVWKVLRERGIKEELVQNIERIYKETKNKVKVGNEYTESFWTEKGVRQGCPLSPLLFIIFIADIEEYIKRRQEGGITIGNRRIYSLAYADDLAILAETEKEMKKVTKYLEKYFKRKELEVNAEKSKMMVCSKGMSRTKREWKWKDQDIEEVSEFKYLGYTFNYNNKDDAHIREVRKRGMAAMVQIWGIGERKFGGDFRRRMIMYNAMVKSICMYAVEIWGMEERKEFEGMQERYLKSILGLERCTPGYMVREETKTEKIMIEAGERVIKYEEKIKREGNVILKQCRREMDKEKWKETRMGQVREEMYRKAGMSIWEEESRDDRGENIAERWREKVLKEEKMEREKRMENSKYNEKYRRWRTESVPKYLQEKSKGERIKTIARYRLGNEWRTSRYWMREEEKECRMCGKETESGWHVMKECDYTNTEETEEELMSEEGKGIEWMYMVKKKRKEMGA